MHDYYQHEDLISISQGPSQLQSAKTEKRGLLSCADLAGNGYENGLVDLRLIERRVIGYLPS